MPLSPSSEVTLPEVDLPEVAPESEPNQYPHMVNLSELSDVCGLNFDVFKKLNLPVKKKFPIPGKPDTHIQVQISPSRRYPSLWYKVRVDGKVVGELVDMGAMHEVQYCTICEVVFRKGTLIHEPCGTTVLQFECPVCKQPKMRFSGSLPCAHYVCDHCEAKLNPRKCPTCRRPLKRSRYDEGPYESPVSDSEGDDEAHPDE